MKKMAPNHGANSPVSFGQVQYLIWHAQPTPSAAGATWVRRTKPRATPRRIHTGGPDLSLVHENPPSRHPLFLVVPIPISHRRGLLIAPPRLPHLFCHQTTERRPVASCASPSCPCSKPPRLTGASQDRDHRLPPVSTLHGRCSTDCLVAPLFCILAAAGSSVD